MSWPSFLKTPQCMSKHLLTKEIFDLLKGCPELIQQTLKLQAAMLSSYEVRIAGLEQKLSDVEADPFKNLYRALNGQVRKITDQLDEVDIRFDGDDKVFDRFIKLNESLRKILENLEFVGIKTGAKQEEEEKKRTNPIEQRATNASKVRPT